MNRLIKNATVLTLIGVVLITGTMVPAIDAKMIETSVYMNQQTASERNDLQSFLAREDVRAKLMELGVNPDDAANRIASLTDQEVQAIQKHINDLPAGSSVLAVLGVVLVVLIVLEMVGVTNVFNRL